jgi:hypothetical protein
VRSIFSHFIDNFDCASERYEGVSKSSRTGRLERELQMVQLCATRYRCITILWVSLVSFAAITLCVASQRVFISLSTQSGNFWIHPRQCRWQCMKFWYDAGRLHWQNMGRFRVAQQGNYHSVNNTLQSANNQKTETLQKKSPRTQNSPILFEGKMIIDSNDYSSNIYMSCESSEGRTRVWTKAKLLVTLTDVSGVEHSRAIRGGVRNNFAQTSQYC